MNTLRLYHAGYEIIRAPDIRFGRKNADFGQGFYLSDDEEFSRRWARERRDAETWLNRYELCADGLNIRRLERDGAWFDYIFANRMGYDDRLSEYDVIVGPIANDTIYDTMGILTSGLLGRDQALQLLLLGPAYEQTVIKTRKALSALRFDGAVRLTADEIAGYRETVRREEHAYQEQLAQTLQAIMETAD